MSDISRRRPVVGGGDGGVDDMDAVISFEPGSVSDYTADKAYSSGLGKPPQLEPAVPCWQSLHETSGRYSTKLILMLALSVMISYADRTNMSLTILEMMKEMGLVNSDGTVRKDIEGYLLAAFFCGYILTQVPGGWLAQRYGGRRVLAVGSIVWSVSTLLLPLAASAGLGWLVVLRVTLGLGEGVCFPSIHVLISNWLRDSEKSRGVAIVTAGSYLGNVAAIGISGPLIRSPYFGWRYSFYFFGFVGLMWNCVWHYFARRGTYDEYVRAHADQASDNDDDTPAETVVVHTNDMNSNNNNNNNSSSSNNNGSSHTNHSNNNEHIDHLDDNHQPIETNNDVRSRLLERSSEAHATTTRVDGVPWCTLLSSGSVWAILINAFCYSWGFYVLVSWLPTYFEQWDVDIASVDAFVIVPYVAQGVIGVGIGFLADYLVLKRAWSVLAVRHLAQGVGMLGPAAALFWAAYGVQSPTEGMVAMTFALGLSSCTAVGHSMLQHDIAPKFAGVLFALGNVCATIPGIVGVAASGQLLHAFSGHWSAPLAIAASLCIFGALVWFALARTKHVV